MLKAQGCGLRKGILTPRPTLGLPEPEKWGSRKVTPGVVCGCGCGNSVFYLGGRTPGSAVGMCANRGGGQAGEGRGQLGESVPKRWWRGGCLDKGTNSLKPLGPVLESLDCPLPSIKPLAPGASPISAASLGSTQPSQTSCPEGWEDLWG